MSKQLDEMETRAQRRLDGMTVNVDAMAQDVLLLVAAVRRLQVDVSEKREPKDLFENLFRPR